MINEEDIKKKIYGLFDKVMAMSYILVMLFLFLKIVLSLHF